jgi:hypothetical protein
LPFGERDRKGVGVRELTEKERRLCEVLTAELPRYRPPNPIKTTNWCAIATVLTVGAVLTLPDQVDLGTSLFAFVVPLIIALRFGGVVAGWYTAGITVAAIAWCLPPRNGFYVASEFQPRFLGMVIGQILVVLSRPGSLGPIERYISRSMRRIRASIKAIASSSFSLIGWLSLPRSTSTS